MWGVGDLLWAELRESRLEQKFPEYFDPCISCAARQDNGLHQDRRALQRHAREPPVAAVDERSGNGCDDDGDHLYAADLARALHAVEEVTQTRRAIVATEIARSRRRLQVMRSSRREGLFFVRGATGELLGLQVARSCFGGYIDASARGLVQGIT